MQTPITDDRVAELVRNDPLAYRWYTIASRNGLTEQQFLTELLLSKYLLSPAIIAGEMPTFEESKKAAEEFSKRYGLSEVK